MTPAAMHSSASELWITPQDVIERARHVLDGIDVDAASDADAQKYVRARRYITAEENALSPSTPWVIGAKSQSVFLNPPGGKIGNRSRPALFWARLMEEVLDRRVTHAVFVAFSIEALATCQGNVTYARGRGRDIPTMLHLTICIPRQRLEYRSRHCPDLMSEADFRAAMAATPVLADEHGQKWAMTSTEKDWKAYLAESKGQKEPLADLIRSRFAKAPPHGSAIVYVPGTIDRREVFAETFGVLGAVRL